MAEGKRKPELAEQEEEEDDRPAMGYDDAEYEMPSYGLARNRRTTAEMYGNVLADYTKQNAPTKDMPEYTSGSVPMGRNRGIAQCGVSTSATASEASCTTVKKVEITSFQYKQN